MPPIRDIISFAPAVSTEKAVKNTVEVQQINSLKSKLRKWKTLTALVVLAATAAAAFTGYALWKDRNRGTYILDPEFTSINSTIYPANTNMLVLPATLTTAGNAIPGWNIRLGEKTKQSIEFSTQHAEGHVFILSSSAGKDEMNLISPTILAAPHRKICFQALFKKDPAFSGVIVATVSLTVKNNGREEIIDRFVSKAPTQIRQGNWIMAKQTFELPSNAVSVKLDIRGTFTGTVLVKDISLENKD